MCGAAADFFIALLQGRLGPDRGGHRYGVGLLQGGFFLLTPKVLRLRFVRGRRLHQRGGPEREAFEGAAAGHDDQFRPRRGRGRK